MTDSKSYPDLQMLEVDYQFIDSILNPLDLDMMYETIIHRDFKSLLKYQSFDFKYLVASKLFNFLLIHAPFSIIKHVICHATNINGRDEFGMTAIHYACCYSSVAVINLLVRKGADILQVDNRNVSAIGYSHNRNNRGVTKFVTKLFYSRSQIKI